MAEQSSFWDGTLLGDSGPYSAADFAQRTAELFGQGTSFNNYGVLAGTGSTFEPLSVQAKSPASTNIEIQIGAALVSGYQYRNTTALTLPVSANAAGNPRIDTVILRLDYTAQTCRAAIKQGTPAASPVSPTLQQDASYWEIPLADLLLANGFTTVSQAVIHPRTRVINTQSAGWESHVYPRNYACGGSLSATVTLAPAQTILVPFALSGNILLDNLVLGATSPVSGMTIAWDLYIQDVNDAVSYTHLTLPTNREV